MSGMLVSSDGLPKITRIIAAAKSKYPNVNRPARQLGGRPEAFLRQE
jgi:hypothetical protein